MEFLSLNNQHDLIDGVKLKKLIVHRDDRGLLEETLKNGWEGFVDDEFPFGQTYFSVTNPGFARDEYEWHNHPSKQVDRFVVLSGNVVVACYDWRKESATFDRLNLFLLGDIQGDENQYLLLVPKNVLHSTCNVGDVPLLYLGNPTTVYDPAEEGRIPMQEIDAMIDGQTPFSWNYVRENWKTAKR